MPLQLVGQPKNSGRRSFPLVGIDEYASWTRDDGLPLDPWLRTHVRIGGRILGTAPASQVLRAPVAARAEWTGTAFRTSGDHVVPGGLGPLRIDLDADPGTMTEGDVWLQHR